MRGIGSLILLFLGLLLMDSINAEEYEVTGMVQKTSPQLQKFSQEYGFRVSVSGDRWNIRLLPVSYTPDEDGFTPIIPDYLEAGSDGTNFFAATSIETFAATAKARSGVRNHSASGIQGTGRIPFAIDPVITGLWWTYASHRYLKQKTDGRVFVPDSALPLRLAGVRMTNVFEVPAAWRLNEAPPFLPTTLVTSNYLHTRRRHLFEVMPAGGPTTNFVLSVQEYKDISGLRLPKVTKLDYFYPHRVGDIKTGIVESPHNGVTKIIARDFSTNVSVTNFVPHLPQNSTVTDYRGLMRSPPDDARSGARDEWFVR
jgi:hypothetical protein